MKTPRLSLLEVLTLVRDLSSQNWQESDGSHKYAIDNQGRKLWFISEDVMQEVHTAVASRETSE